ncbi:unnamed protein product [Rotaria sordida]|uniref:LITAF domain-containing protein n=2 Tax=Rotaria sordida TaxID=392033 RepID=A0A815DGG6_9BILA|nr:unnamed protein product [Rotaria sordida]CAF3509946.1 unnamed protein product [Rotaria sordida]
MNMNLQPIYQAIPTQPQPIYQSIPTQPQPIYQAIPTQPQPIYRSITTHPQPIYQAVPTQPQAIHQVASQQLPPTYAMGTQLSRYAVPIQQQPLPVYNNQNLSTMYPTGPGILPPNQNKWPRKPVGLVCPRCSATVTTRVKTEITIITLLSVVLLCLFICILFWMPLCMSMFKKSIHYCPYCNSVLGVRKEL